MTSEQLAQLVLDLDQFQREHVDPADDSTQSVLNRMRIDIAAEMTKQHALGN